MGFVRSPSLPNQYPEEIQLRVYQTFIFSIPILLGVILLLLFYLFYIKRRSSDITTPPAYSRTSNDANLTTLSESGLENELKSNLCNFFFDEQTKEKDPMCCVCLGEFELKEELVQVPLCKHVFHRDCIHHWLYSNSTCPLCRANVIPLRTISHLHHPPSFPVSFGG